MTEYQPDDFGPDEHGPQFAVLDARLTAHGYPPLHVYDAIKNRTQRFQLAQGWTGTEPGGNADGYVGPVTWRRLQAQPKPTTPPPAVWPASILDLVRWKLTTPLGEDDDPLEVRPPGLLRFVDARCFFVRGRAVVFRAWAGGTTTENSNYTRSELRELDAAGDEIAWSNADARTHTLTGRCAVALLPEDDPEVVVGQFHDDTDDVVMVRVVGDPDDPDADLDVFAEWSKGKGKGSTKELLGTVGRGEYFDFTLEADRAGMRAAALGEESRRDGLVKDELYAKAGCYGQFHDGVAEVEFTDLDMWHRAA